MIDPTPILATVAASKPAEKPIYDRFLNVESSQLDLLKRIGKLERESADCAHSEALISDGLLKRIVNLEQQVANQALAMQTRKQLADAKTLASEPSASIKSQAAATQATEHLYAPLRSDTKPLLEMSAFVRKIGMLDLQRMSDISCINELYYLVEEAKEILKRST